MEIRLGHEPFVIYEPVYTHVKSRFVPPPPRKVVKCWCDKSICPMCKLLARLQHYATP